MLRMYGILETSDLKSRLLQKHVFTMPTPNIYSQDVSSRMIISPSISLGKNWRGLFASASNRGSRFCGGQTEE